MHEMLAQDLHYALLALDGLRQTSYWLPIVGVTLIAFAAVACQKPLALPLIPLAPLCSVVVGNWFWFSLVPAPILRTDQNWYENTMLALLVGLAVGITLACGLIHNEPKPVHDDSIGERLLNGKGVLPCLLALPVATLVAQIAAILVVGGAVTFAHDPLSLVLLFIVLGALCGGACSCAVLIIIL